MARRNSYADADALRHSHGQRPRRRAGRGAGVVALAGLILFRRAEKLPGWIVAATLVFSLATSGLMGWTANLGGQIRHTEIRAGFMTLAETETEGKQKEEKEEGHE
jgi:hypothetical protein